MKCHASTTNNKNENNHVYCGSEAFVVQQRKIYKMDPEEWSLHGIQLKSAAAQLKLDFDMFFQSLSAPLLPVLCVTRLQPQVVGGISHILLDRWKAFWTFIPHPAERFLCLLAGSTSFLNSQVGNVHVIPEHRNVLLAWAPQWHARCWDRCAAI